MEIDAPGHGIGPPARPEATADPQTLDRPPCGLRNLIPGYAQCYWGQRERGLVLIGSYITAMVIACFLWGTATGLILLGFAYVTHSISTIDALTQEAFPPRGLSMRGFLVSGVLAFGVYLPALTWLTLVAWPGIGDGPGADGYLVNCYAYQKTEPQRDDWVCFRTTPGGEPRVGRVVALDGQEVDWSADRLHVDGSAVDDLLVPFFGSRVPKRMTYRMPRGHVLINPRDRLAEGSTDLGLVMVSRDQIVGRAWAKLYPIRERQLLFSGPRPARTQNS